jgi:8-oxo-dGTP pyrophosphatase MutT (NUDIX family)
MGRSCAAFAIVAGIPGHEGEIPLIRSNDKPGDRWGLPGGSSEGDEDVAEYTMLREVREEIGVTVKPDARKILSIPRESHDVVFFYAEHYDGEPRLGEEVAEIKFFNAIELYELVRTGKVYYNHARGLSAHFGFGI